MREFTPGFGLKSARLVLDLESSINDLHARLGNYKRADRGAIPPD